jgi:hypothetical protein
MKECMDWNDAHQHSSAKQAGILIHAKLQTEQCTDTFGNRKLGTTGTWRKPAL